MALQIHQVLATAVLLILLLLGLWGIIAGLLKRSVGGSYRSTFILAVGLVLIQDVAGIVVFFSVHPPQMVHLLYGAVLPIILLGGYSYAAGTTARREALTMGITCLIMFVMVLVRAFPTGTPR